MKKKALILGGGFAGIQAAINLHKSGLFDVTLVSDRNYLYLYPISIWVPFRTAEFDQVKVPLAKIQEAYRFNLLIDPVKEIKSKEKKVIFEQHTLEYDFLVIAFGAEKMKHKGIENTLSICGKPEVSFEIRDKIDALIQQGSGKIAIGFGGNPVDKSAVRGGPAFEFIFNLHHLLKKRGIRNNFELSFFAPMDEPGAKMGRKSLKMLDKMFNQYGIQKKFGEKITGFERDGILFEDNSKLNSDLTMFIAASAGHSILEHSDLPLNSGGFILINDHGLVRGSDSVYAVGDIAAIEGPEWIAKQGHIAELMGRNAAYNIIQSQKGSQKRKGYQKHLNILCVMDTGSGAAFVFRNHKRAFIIPMPIFGHWLKKAWGIYSKLTKTGKFPRIPGM